MSVQVSYKKQFALGIMLLLVVLVAVESISRVWWYNIETCAFEQSDVYADLPPEKKRQMCIQTYGGFGFAKEYDIERKYREARLYQVAPVSTNLILSYIAEHVLKLPRSY